MIDSNDQPSGEIGLNQNDEGFYQEITISGASEHVLQFTESD